MKLIIEIDLDKLTKGWSHPEQMTLTDKLNNVQEVIWSGLQAVRENNDLLALVLIEDKDLVEGGEGVGRMVVIKDEIEMVVASPWGPVPAKITSIGIVPKSFPDQLKPVPEPGKWMLGQATDLAVEYRNRWNKHEGYSSHNMLEALQVQFPNGCADASKLRQRIIELESDLQAQTKSKLDIMKGSVELGQRVHELEIANKTLREEFVRHANLAEERRSATLNPVPDPITGGVIHEVLEDPPEPSTYEKMMDHVLEEERVKFPSGINYQHVTMQTRDGVTGFAVSGPVTPSFPAGAVTVTLDGLNADETNSYQAAQSCVAGKHPLKPRHAEVLVETIDRLLEKVLDWTNESPTQVGYYWYREREGSYEYIKEVGEHNEKLLAHSIGVSGSDPVSYFKGQWKGPLKS